MIPLSLVPHSKKFLWYYDEEMTHDLIAIEYGLALPRLIVLVERATTLNYAFKEDYSQKLFYALLPYSQAVRGWANNPFDIAQSGLNLIIPPHSGTVVITYYTHRIKSVFTENIHVLDKNIKILSQSSETIEFSFNPLWDSVVVSGDNSVIGEIKAQITARYSERSLESFFNLPQSSFQLRFLERNLSIIGGIAIGAYRETSGFGGGPIRFSDWIYNLIPKYAPSQTTESTTPAGLSPCGALFFAYPLHEPLQHYQNSSNIIIGNFISQPITGEAINYYNLLQTQSFISEYSAFGSGVRFSNAYLQDADGDIRKENYLLHRAKLIGGELIIFNFDRVERQENVPIVEAITIGQGTPPGAYDPLGTGMQPSGNITPNPGEWWEGADHLDIFTKTGRCGWYSYRSQEEILPAHWTRGAGIEDFLSTTWAEEREIYHNRNQTLETILGGRVDENLVDINNSDLLDFAENLITWEIFNYPLNIFEEIQLLIEGCRYTPLDQELRWYNGYDDRFGVGYPNQASYNPLFDATYPIFIREFINKMNENILLQEIHACLGAGEYAYSAPDTPVYMHMARRLEDVAKAIGHSYNLDGSIMAIRQSKHLDRGATIPAGWSLGQFGRNNGGSNNPNAQQGGLEHEERLGIVYEVKGNKFRINEANGEEEVTEGGYVLCENLAQYLHVMLQDLDRSLGLQQLGSFAVSNPNYNPDYKGNDESIKAKYYKYNGLGESWLDTLYLLADTNRHAAQANVGSLKAQAISQEILGALGVAVHEKVLAMQVDDSSRMIKYPGFNGNAMTLVDLLLWTLMNISLLNDA